MDSKTEERIKEILERCVSNILKKQKKSHEFKPFHEALLTKELLVASAIERSFSSSLGQKAIEEVSLILAEENGDVVERQKQTWVSITPSAISEIERICASLRSGGSKPNWKQEIERIAACSGGVREPRRIITDLWIKRDQKEHFLSLKTVKPNLGQCIEAKNIMLYLKAHDRTYNAYLALYYNPYGTQKTDYKWSILSKAFDVYKDDCILIGQEYWDFVGGKGSYQKILECFEEVGVKTKKLLYLQGH